MLTEDATTVDPLQQWAEAIKQMPALDGIPDWVTDEDLRHAFEISEVANLTDTERAKWEQAFRDDQDLRGQVLQQYIYGKTLGLEKGQKEGFAETVNLLHSSGMQPEEIAERLHRSVSEISALIK